MKAIEADPIGLAMIPVMLMLIFGAPQTDAQQVGDQQSESTVAFDASQRGAQSEPPQIIRDGQVEMRLEADPITARIAEPIQLRLIFDAPAGSQVTMPVIGPAFGQLEVVDQRLIKELPIDGDPTRRRWILLVTLESIESGEFTMPSMEILYRLAEDAEDTASRATQRSVRSLPFVIEVTSLLGENPDPTNFRDIKDAMETPASEPPDNFSKWVITGIGLSALALLGGLWWWRRDRTPIPIEWASQEIARIDSLLASDSITSSDGYAALSDVLRRFLEQELGIPATAMSSEELREELTSRSCPPPTIARLTQFLAEADEVKFSGRSRPTDSRTDSPASCLREIVQQVHQMSLAKVPLAKVPLAKVPLAKVEGE